jgi:hypothetical protein
MKNRLILRERISQKSTGKSDSIVKSPYAALRFILRHCSVRLCKPHSSVFARLASGAFYFADHFQLNFPLFIGILK